jgi:hypothetical protein
VRSRHEISSDDVVETAIQRIAAVLSRPDPRIDDRVANLRQMAAEFCKIEFLVTKLESLDQYLHIDAPLST